MTLRNFKIFIAVCDSMNMTCAAEGLYMSQSAVSQAIAEMEKHYGVKLFERLSRKLYLTDAGQKLLGYARSIIRMTIEAENDIKSLKQNGSIRIGASVTVGSHVLPQLVKYFENNNPQTGIEVFENNTERIENLILADQIDIGLVEGETTSPDVSSHMFMDDELVLICSPSHRFAGNSIIDPKELNFEKFIVREKGSGTRKLFEDKMNAGNFIFNVTWTCSNSDTIKRAVAKGLGISVISSRAVVNEVTSGILFQTTINGIELKRQFKIIYHRNKYLTESMQKFIDLCMTNRFSIKRDE